MIPPINIMKHEHIKEDVMSGKIKAVCTYCKVEPCYELSMQEGRLVGMFLYDRDRLVCRECYNFMQETGNCVTGLVRFLLRVKVLLTKRRGNDSKNPA